MLNYYIDEWLKNQRYNRRKPFVGSRGYKHFDLPISLKQYSTKGDLRNSLIDIESLKQHKYYPLIRKDKYTKRYTINNQKELIIERKCRPIMYAAHRDAPVFSFYGFILRRVYEREIASTPGLSECVIAYRKIPRKDIPSRNKSNIDFAKEAFTTIGELDKDVAILCLDIKGFFDSLSHSYIENSMSIIKDTAIRERLKYVLKPLLKYRYVFYRDIKSVYGDNISSWANSVIFNHKIRNTDLIHKNKKKKGIPQGTPISDIIANMYMLDFDRAVLNMISKMDTHYYRRYSDDIFLVVPTNEAKNIYRYIANTLEKYGLCLSESKTEAFTYDSKTRKLTDCTGDFVEDDYKKNRPMLQYLGFIFDTDNIYIRPKSLAKLAKKRKTLLKKQDKDVKKKSHGAKPKNKIAPLAYIKRASENIDSRSLHRQAIKQRKKFKKVHK